MDRARGSVRRVAQERYSGSMKATTIPSVRVEPEFVARGLRSRDEAKRTGDYVDADDVLAILQGKLDAARVKLAKSAK
jgi:hypothetical protein